MTPAILETYPTRELWLAARDTGLGGSDAPVVVGLSPYTTQRELYERKIGNVQPVEQTAQMTRGTVMEPHLVAWWAAQPGVEIQPTPTHSLYRSTVDPFRFYSRDALLRVDGADVLGEIKTVNWFSADAWADGAPLDVQAQVQQGLDLLDLLRGIVLAYFVPRDVEDDAIVAAGGWAPRPHEIRMYTVARNDKFIAALQSAEREFWDRVQRRDPPPFEGGDIDLIKSLFPRDDGSVIALPPEAVSAVDAWAPVAEKVAALESEARRLKKEKDALEVPLRAWMGEAVEADVPGGRRLQLKTVERKGYEVAATSYRTLKLK